MDDALKNVASYRRGMDFASQWKRWRIRWITLRVKLFQEQTDGQIDKKYGYIHTNIHTCVDRSIHGESGRGLGRETEPKEGTRIEKKEIKFEERK